MKIYELLWVILVCSNLDFSSDLTLAKESNILSAFSFLIKLTAGLVSITGYKDYGVACSL